MKCIVTGGAGFIGSHLVDRLLKEDHFVVVIDNCNTGKIENLPAKHPKFIFFGADILEDIDHIFEDVDIVFHLAALTRPQDSIKRPLETNRVNVEGTLKILKHCHENKVKRVVFASSSSLYGVQDKYPTPEDVTPKPMSPYALQKFVGEQYAQLFHRMYGMEVNCVRPFNVYGPRQRPDLGYAAAVPKFIDSLNRGEAPQITGDGTQARDFTYVDDVVSVFMLAATSKIFGESFNAGNGNPVTVNKLFETISELMFKDHIEPIHIDPVLEPHLTHADMSKTKRILGFSPKFDIKEGLKRTIEGMGISCSPATIL